MTKPTDTIALTRELVKELVLFLEDFGQTSAANDAGLSTSNLVRNLRDLLSEPKYTPIPSIIDIPHINKTIMDLPRDADGAIDAITRHGITPGARWTSDGRSWMVGDYRVSGTDVEYRRQGKSNWTICPLSDVTHLLAAEQRGELVRIDPPAPNPQPPLADAGGGGIKSEIEKDWDYFSRKLRDDRIRELESEITQLRKEVSVLGRRVYMSAQSAHTVLGKVGETWEHFIPEDVLANPTASAAVRKAKEQA